MDARPPDNQIFEKPPLEARDSGISCYTPSPPPKKSSLPQRPNIPSKQRELRHRVPSRELSSRESPLRKDSPGQYQTERPPRLDLSSITGEDSDYEFRSPEPASADKIFDIDDRLHPELAVAAETPSTEHRSRLSNPSSTPDGYRTDVEYCSSSPSVSSSSSPGSAGLRGLRRCGNEGLEEQSEGNIMKVRLKLKSSDPVNSSGRAEKEEWSSGRTGSLPTRPRSKGSESDQQARRASETGTLITKYAPLPGIGREVESITSGEHRDPSPLGSSPDNRSQQLVSSEEIRERRIKALERSTSQTDMRRRVFPTPPPQSAKTVSRRAMRRQQFDRRKSASHAESALRASSKGSLQSDAESSNVLLAVRLPNGARVQNLFRSSETLSRVVKFALKEGKCSQDLSEVCLVTSDMPNRKLTELEQTIQSANLIDRTLLHLEEM